MKKKLVLALGLSLPLALGILGLQGQSFGDDKDPVIRYEVTTRDGKVYTGGMTDKLGKVVIATEDGAVTLEKADIKSLRRLGLPKVDLDTGKPPVITPVTPVAPVTPPAEDPPAETPPVTPPAEDPPAETPPVAPPAEDPPAETPPVTPPAETPPVTPPAEDPPAETPPVTPPAEDPPAETPPVTPPAEDPPAETPPVTPPTEDPPAEDPPVTPPAENPPAETPPVTPPAEDPPVENPPVVTPAENPPVENPPVVTPKKPEVVIALEDRVIQILTRDERRIVGRAIDVGGAFRVATKDGFVEIPKSEIINFNFVPAPANSPELPKEAYKLPTATLPVTPSDPPVTAPSETTPPTVPPAENPPTETPPTEPPVTPPTEAPKIAPPGEEVPVAPVTPTVPATPVTPATPVSTAPATPVPAAGTEERAELSLYKEQLSYDELIEKEEEEFGPIDFDYRGPVELTLALGGIFWDGGVATDKLKNSAIGSTRLTFNFGDTNAFAAELYFGYARTNFTLRLRNQPFLANGNGNTPSFRNKVNIYVGDANIVYRPKGLRFDYAQIYLSFGASIAYFDRFRNANPDNDYGYGGNLELGLDYKLDRTWSIKIGAKGRALYSRVLRDQDARDTSKDERIRYMFEPTFGVVIHFD